MDDSETSYAVNPNDPAERQALEQKLENDTQIEHHIHSTIQQEQQLADAAQHGGYTHQATEGRVQELENKEQIVAGVIVEDHQNIDHWDHAHPGWDQTETTPENDTDLLPLDDADSDDVGTLGG